VGSAGLSLSLYRFIGRPEEQTSTSTTTADSAPTGLVFGLAFDAGYALSPKFALLLRGFGGLGSSEGTLASLGAVAPALAYRVSRRWWLGAGVALGAGAADSDASRRDLLGAQSNATIAYQTAFALGPHLELSFVLDQNEGGHWLVSLMPTTLFSVGGGQSTLFLPFMAGYRWF
jgi:long-subunit fatty acid transport protein